MGVVVAFCAMVAAEIEMFFLIILVILNVTSIIAFNY
jgi:hypothetical protein